MGILETAYAEIGFKQSSINCNKYNNWYYHRRVSGAHYPWCAVFISWCANKSNTSPEVIPQTASVTKLVKFYVDRALFNTSADYTPKTGDLAIWYTKFYHHVGLVFEVTPENIKIIEGNTLGGVVLKNYSRPLKLYGYATPQY